MIATDKNNYDVGETITVSGRTCHVLDKGVTIEILNPEGELYKTISATPNINGQFSASLVVEGEHGINGTYIARTTDGMQTSSPTFVVPEFPVTIIIFATAVSLTLATRIIPKRALRMI